MHVPGGPDGGATGQSDPPGTHFAPPTGTGRPIRFAYMPALDGMRAIAVTGVMLYHGGAPGVAGGFLGVNIFFVLSGFLITSLLIGEWVQRSTIRLGRFWARRARRLLPALLVMLVAVALWVRFHRSGFDVSALRADALSTLFYVANWHMILSGGSYFAQTAQPSPLEHTWSLAIEEQFYIVWPPVVLVLMHCGRRFRPTRQLWPVLAAAVTGAIGSAVAMRILFLRGTSVTRLYEGTDTRSQDILVGASLAVGLAIWARHRTPGPDGPDRDGSPGGGAPSGSVPAPHRLSVSAVTPVTAWEVRAPGLRRVLQVVGWTSLVGLVVAWTRTTGTTPFLFEGGYFLFALGVGVVIACVVTTQRSSLASALGTPVLRSLGRISYGVYLWHLPLFIVIDPATVHLTGLPLLAVRMAAAVGAATLSFVLVEEPVRRRVAPSRSDLRSLVVAVGALAVTAAVVVAATVPAAVDAAARIPVPVGPEYRGPPVSVTLLGDSLSFTAGWAMATTGAERPYDVSLHSEGILGCGVMVNSGVVIHGVAASPAASCDAASPPSQQLPAIWSGLVSAQHPNVTMLMAGRWEETDQVIDGALFHIGEPAFDADLEASLNRAVDVGTSTGAYMMLLTAPCDSSGQQPNGQPWPEDSAARRLDYDRILRTVAARHPGDVEVYDFGAMVCPGGVFRSTADGVAIRTPDGIHFPYQAGSDGPTARWLAWKLLPEAVRVGRLQMAGTPLT